MSAKTYWNLLILFGVLCQGIIGTIAEKDFDESSELLVRQKRVINRTPGFGDVRELIKNTPYVVTVKKVNSRESCVGVILSNHIVLTAARCVDYDIALGRVYSGSARRPNTPRSSHFVQHNVIDKKVFPPNHPTRLVDSIALISVTPYFNYSVNTHHIELCDGHIHHGLNGTVSGWGCSDVGDPGTTNPDYLRTITVPIISSHECAMLYTNILAILDSDVCTFDATRHQYCSFRDAGAPLVIRDAYNMKKLVGIHIWTGTIHGRAYKPDIFANVQHPIYRNWISQNIHILNQHHHT